jgi:peptidoglycan/LPS O-acetylase OafA/YrhL
VRQTQSRLIELDLLRFVAALAVVGHHLVGPDFAIYPIVHLGSLGVELFFMISGFVVLWSAQGKSGWQFACSRISRLYPTFWTALLIGVVLALWSGARIPLRQVLGNATMFPGPLGVEYFDIVYWTLLREWLFYAVIFALIVGRQIRHFERWLAGWTLVCMLYALFPVSERLFNLTLNGYAPYFLIGCYLYAIYSSGATAARIGMIVLCLLLGLPQSLYAIEHGHLTDLGTYVIPATVAVVSAEALLFLALTLGYWRLPKWAVWPWLGALTYPLYLSHFRNSSSLNQLLGDRLGEGSRLAVLIAVPMLLAIFMALTVERHVCGRFNRWLVGLPGRVASVLRRRRYPAKVNSRV